ncbi:hypothetical protein ACFE04_023787 [Oxalis oulophora]
MTRGLPLPFHDIHTPGDSYLYTRFQQASTCCLVYEQCSYESRYATEQKGCRPTLHHRFAYTIGTNSALSGAGANGKHSTRDVSAEGKCRLLPLSAVLSSTASVPPPPPPLELEIFIIPLTKDATRDQHLLIALSKVSKLIHHWTTTQKLHDSCVTSSSNDNADSDWITNSFAHLLPLLTFESQYVRHATANILVSLSQFFISSGSNWDLYIQYLCLSLEMAASYALPSCLAPSIDTIDGPNSVSVSFAISLKPKLREANWCTVAELTRVLRRILKLLKQDDCDDKCYKIFLDSVCPCILNLSPLISQISVVQKSGNFKMDGQSGFCADLRNIDLAVFLGVFIQFICSLVEESSSTDNYSIIFVINQLVPELLCCCLSNGDLLVDRSISYYYGYKLLVLMVRLSFQTTLDSSFYFSWIQLLHKYFQDLLSRSITECESGHSEGDSLDGSPFLLYVSDKDISKICTRHLQRRAVFLFLRCSFSLVRSRNDVDTKCTCATMNSSLASDIILDVNCCSNSKGLLELHKWLARHFPMDIFVNREVYMKKSMNFASAFISLYIHEDDLLFKVLLQLLDVPVYEDKQFQKEKWTFQNMSEDILFHVSNVFNPFYLFMAFLAELQYDHQVLIDYLISNDTGISCGEYLLKCLRVICDSRQLFIVEEEVTNHSLIKRRKLKVCADLLSVNKAKSLHRLEEESVKDRRYGEIKGLGFMEAKTCLLSLKHSLESLHKKNLFPYNPRFTKFSGTVPRGGLGPHVNNYVESVGHPTVEQVLGVLISVVVVLQVEMEKREKHFVLVHGSCHGAWCWFKVSTLLKSAGHRVTALDLAASGIHPKQVDGIHSLPDYHQPLIEFLTALAPEEKVVLVGHSMGGVGVSTAMEMFPEKISVAVFATAFMPGPHLKFSKIREEHSRRKDSNLVPVSTDSKFEFADGADSPPTSLLFGPNLLATKFYQLSPLEDLMLATLLVRPFRIFRDATLLDTNPTLSEEKYGSVPRVYVVCDQDLMLEEDFQRWMIEKNPPVDQEVIPGSDHMVMFSKPHELASILQDIAQKYL